MKNYGFNCSEQIAAIMENLRSNPPKEFGDWKVLAMRDYTKDERIDIATGEKSATGLPYSNVLYFELSDDAWCCARPSGTEPKIKFYMGVKGANIDDAKEKVVKLTDALKSKLA